MAVLSTDLIMVERGGTLHKAAVGDLPAGHVGLTYLGTTVGTNTGAVDIALTGGFTRYQIDLEQVYPSLDDKTLLARLLIGGTPVTSATYDYAFSWIGAALDLRSAQTGALLAIGAGNTIQKSFEGTLDLVCGQGVRYNNMRIFGRYRHTGGGEYGCASTISVNSSQITPSGIRFLYDGGNINGKFHLFGKAGA